MNIERNFISGGEGYNIVERDVEGIVLKPIFTGVDYESGSNIGDAGYRYVVNRRKSHCGNCGVNVFDFNTDYYNRGDVEYFNCRHCKSPLYSQSDEYIRVVVKRKPKIIQFFKRMWAMLRR